MIFSPNFTEIGYVEKTHGTAGWIKINFYDPKNSIRLRQMEFLFLQMDSDAVPYMVEQVNMKAGLVKFFDFDNPTIARKLVGKVIFTDKELPKTKDSTVWLPLIFIKVLKRSAEAFSASTKAGWSSGVRSFLISSAR